MNDPVTINQKDFTEYNDPDWQEVITYRDQTPSAFVWKE